MTTWLFYRASCKAEDYTVLAGRLTGVLPDLRRIYNNGEAGELLLNGEKTDVFVKFVLVADKPFIRHVCGLLSHNADSFDAPFCVCCDETERPALYDFTQDKHTHYGQYTFEDLCHRAHVAPFEALGQKEPEHWFFACPCCSAMFGTDHGGRAALDAMDEQLSAMEPNGMANALKTHAKQHRGARPCCRSITLCMTRCTASTTRRTRCWTRRSTSTWWHAKSRRIRR